MPFPYGHGGYPRKNCEVQVGGVYAITLNSKKTYVRIKSKFITQRGWHAINIATGKWVYVTTCDELGRKAAM